MHAKHRDSLKVVIWAFAEDISFSLERTSSLWANWWSSLPQSAGNRQVLRELWLPEGDVLIGVENLTDILRRQGNLPEAKSVRIALERMTSTHWEAKATLPLSFKGKASGRKKRRCKDNWWVVCAEFLEMAIQTLSEAILSLPSEREASGKKLRGWTEKCWKSGDAFLERSIQTLWTAETSLPMPSNNKETCRNLKRCTEKC